MTNTSLIITLIQQDLKHHQLLTTLAHCPRVEQEKQHLELLNVVQALMDVPESAELVWGKTYSKYMGLAPWYPLEATTEGLRHQAELCYTHLSAIVDVEREWLGRS
jgi:hypothetical protein